MRSSYFLLGAVLTLAACGGGGDFKYAPGTASIERVPARTTAQETGYDVVSKSDLEKRDYIGMQVAEQRMTQSIALRALDVPGVEGRRTADGFVITVPDKAFFVHPSAQISPNTMPYVTRLAAAMLKDPSVSLDVVAHYHFDGQNRKSLVESQKRAVAFQAALLSRGVGVSRVRAIGAGDQNPVASNRDPVGQQENRRIEFHFKRGS